MKTKTVVNIDLKLWDDETNDVLPDVDNEYISDVLINKDSDKIIQYDLKTVLNSFFVKSKYNNLPDTLKSKMCYIINRLMAIQFPIYSAMLSQNKINQIYVLNYWRDVISKKYDKTPSWLFSNKKIDTLKNEDYIPSKKTLMIYMNTYDCSEKDIKDAMLKFPDRMKDELKNIEFLDSYDQK